MLKIYKCSRTTGKIFILLLLISFISCNNNSSEEKKQGIPADTTALGKQIEETSEKIIANPTDADLYHHRARLYYMQRNIQAALQDMSKAMSLDTTRASYFVTLADLYFAINKTGNAKAALEKCLSIEPDNLEANMKLAELYFYVRSYQKSLGYLDGVLKKDVHNPKAYFIKGMNFKWMGDTSKAISSFQTAIEQNPDYYDAYMQLGIVTDANGSPLALQYYNGALRLHPNSEEAFYGRGLWYQNHDSLDLAIQDYTNIVQLNPKNQNAHFNLGYIHLVYLKVYSEAAKHFSNAIDADSTYAEAWFNRGLCYESLGNIDFARTDFEKAVQFRPGYEMAMAGIERVKK